MAISLLLFYHQQQPRVIPNATDGHKRSRKSEETGNNIQAWNYSVTAGGALFCGH